MNNLFSLNRFVFINPFSIEIVEVVDGTVMVRMRSGAVFACTETIHQLLSRLDAFHENRRKLSRYDRPKHLPETQCSVPPSVSG